MDTMFTYILAQPVAFAVAFVIPVVYALFINAVRGTEQKIAGVPFTDRRDWTVPLAVSVILAVICGFVGAYVTDILGSEHVIRGAMQTVFVSAVTSTALTVLTDWQCTLRISDVIDFYLPPVKVKEPKAPKEKKEKAPKEKKERKPRFKSKKRREQEANEELARLILSQMEKE